MSSTTRYYCDGCERTLNMRGIGTDTVIYVEAHDPRKHSCSALHDSFHYCTYCWDMIKRFATTGEKV